MRKPSHPCVPDGACREVSEVLARVGDKWAVLVIATLAEGGLRFSELRRALDAVSQKVLTATLRGLERDGFVTRSVTPSIPPRVDYDLTPLGRDVLVPVAALAEWALANRTRVHAARAAYDMAGTDAAHRAHAAGAAARGPKRA